MVIMSTKLAQITGLFFLPVAIRQKGRKYEWTSSVISHHLQAMKVIGTSKQKTVLMQSIRTYFCRPISVKLINVLAVFHCVCQMRPDVTESETIEILRQTRRLSPNPGRI